MALPAVTDDEQEAIDNADEQQAHALAA